MKPLRLNQQRVLFVIVVLLLVFSVLPADVVGTVAKVPRGLVERLLGIASEPLHSLSVGLRNKTNADDKSAADDRLSINNEELHYLVRNLETQLALLEAENRALRQMPDTHDMSGFWYESARVIMPTRDPRNPMLTLNRGTRQGVREGLVVAYSGRLIGRIMPKPGIMTSNVKPINTPGTELFVRIAPDDSGSTRGENHKITATQDGRQFWSDEISTETSIRVGHRARLNANNWPDEAQGLLVGEVVRVEVHPDQPGVAVRVIIEPKPPIAATTKVHVMVPKTGP